MEDSNYAPKVRDDVAQRIAHMAGIGKGLALDARPYFRLGTSLTSLPGAMAYALKRDDA